MCEGNPSSRRKSLRIPKYDYSQPNAYFITICSFEKKLLFGKIQQGQVILSEAGEIVGEVWDSLSNRYPIVELDAFIVMPNHVHGILKVMSDEVGAIHELPLQTDVSTDPEEGRIRRRKMLLPKVVGDFKMNTSKRIN